MPMTAEAETPNSKTQAPKNFQNSKVKKLTPLVWILEFGDFLGFGAWDLGFPPLMAEVPDAGKDHRHFAFVRRGDHFAVAH